jgi:hypothetical protein
MKHRLLRAFTALPIAGLLVTFQPAASPVTVQAFDYSKLNQIQKRILSGFAKLESDPDDPGNSGTPPNNYSPRPNSNGCPVNLSSNIKVNQACLNLTDRDLQGRAQANNETAIAQDPLQPNHVVATSNNYLRGDGNCIADYSVDGGRNWTDSQIPMQFTRGIAQGIQRQYWDSGGDPAVAWDTKGNAYFQCMVFARGNPVSQNVDLSSAVYVYRSTGNFGASWNFPGRPVVVFQDVLGNGLGLEDKPYMTIDNHVGSPFQDRIYVTWTFFDFDTGSGYIFEAYSADYGEHFSAPVLVSINAPQLCTNTFGAGTEHGSCNENQFSQPFTGPDGALYVAFDNYNNALRSAQDNRNQVLLAKSTDGGQTFSSVVKVADYYDLPDCDTYQGAGQDPFRACVPEKGTSQRSVFRAANYPVGGVNPQNPNQLVVTFGSYINSFSNEGNGCVPAGFAPDGQNAFTGVKTPGACNNKIVLSISNDAGTTFTGTTTDPRVLPTVNQDSGQATTDQWWQWLAFNKNGKLAVSYYDRQYGDDETTGYSDFSLSGSGDLVRFGIQRLTSSSMPPPTQFPNRRGNGTFLGDYTGLTAVDNALPLWSDTRSPDLFLCPGTGTPTVAPAVCGGTAANGLPANDQDIFTVNVSIPSR